MTDDAAFERLATAVLREAKPEYATLVHTGVNVAGKTVKAPVDGITFVTGANPPRMIAAHHTTCARPDLRSKWLHDPSTVTPRKGGKPTAPPGDVLKTAEIVAAERKRTPLLRATLILTTNQEPPEELVRDTIAAGAERGIDIDIWSVTSLGHFLDNADQGQWLRYKHLGIDQERLSADLLASLSLKSLEIHGPHEEPDAWVSRTLDQAIAAASDDTILFVAAGSGLGKSIACYKQLRRHVHAGGYGLIMPHEIIAAAQTPDEAIDACLRKLHPKVAPDAGSTAQQLCSADHPLLLVVEDINRSGQASLLAEKLSKWSGPLNSDTPAGRPWRLLCPIWPQIIASLGEEARKRIQRLAVIGDAFSPSEGREAVQRRGRTRGKTISDLDADAISDALGHDPLLIALHEPSKAPHPGLVIEEYANAALARIAANRGDYTAADYRLALRALATVLLSRRQISPLWSDITAWLRGQADALAMLRHLVHQANIVRLSSEASDARLLFRHDRVRDHLFADTIAEAIKNESLDDGLLADPYFAEVLGAALNHDGISPSFVDRVRATNPLALFFALRVFREPTTAVHRAVLASIDGWLADPDTHAAKFNHLRWAALAALSETESTDVVAIVWKFGRSDRRAWTASQALFRNGDLAGGLQLCLDVEPGVGAPWRDRQIEHAKNRFGANLRAGVDKLLRQVAVEPNVRVAALRLAGYLADPQLADAIEMSWNSDPAATSHLGDYLWAAAQCCGTDPERLLGPVCDAWATLPTSEKSPSPRDNLAADHVRWAFHKDVPVSAIPYFLKRARFDDLRWPITYMLHGVDHPDAVEFVVRELACRQRRIEGKGGFSPFSHMAPDEWRRRQEEKGRPMSRESRERLLAFWQNQSTEEHLRRQSFRFWAATHMDGDLEILRSVDSSDLLAESALWQRLARADRTAIPALLTKLHGDRHATWWRLARHVWSEPVSLALNEELQRRRTWAATSQTASGDNDRDYVLSEIVMDLLPSEAEPLLLKHWDHLAAQAFFVQAALFLATPRLLAMAKAAIESSSDPAKNFRHITMRYGIKERGRPGITRRSQIEALIPYLGHLDELSIYQFWELCNERGWCDLRRQHFDHRLSDKFRRPSSDEAQAMGSLDQLAANGNWHWIDRWIEDYLESGATLDQVFGVIEKWLVARKTIEAMLVAAASLVQAGRRQDIGLLNIDVEPRDAAAAIRADTEFAVRRRALM
ncbi:hypothetical protein FDV58_17970 [Bradyrhizobium elkanii]|uniref:Uncharacterized protein n=1 Tax=Bradyrhizobium elkanii TaxID=29448 RepID=A0A4V6CXK8_BRAEL|nr:hypothetical protein [Bradyrhizobium elkanii]TKV80135.1 hypothetical protein FDV58_17970 [Bradyrhizobium elkanii]